jgi:catecholate siderophore receptor
VGGLTYQSRVFLNSENTQAVPSHMVADAMLAYNFGPARLALNAYNLGDKLYYSQVNGGRVVTGGGRAFILSLGFAF